MNRLDLAKQLASTLEQRQGTHGDAVHQHENAAALWSAYLGVKVTAAQVAMCIALLKVSRTMSGNDIEPDHYLDMAGYALIAHDCAAGAARAATWFDPAPATDDRFAHTEVSL